MLKRFTIQGKVIRYPGTGGWYFVELSKEHSEELRRLTVFEVEKVGLNYIKCHARIGATSWDTTLFPQKKPEPYLIAIKASVRKAENVAEGDTIRIECEV